MLNIRSIFVTLFLMLFLQVNFAYAEGSVKGVQAKKDLEVVLQQHKVVKQGEKETLVVADRIKPGEVIEYQAIYHNTTKMTIHGLNAIVPIPVETEYLADTAKPANAEASIDGKNYAPMPLRKKVLLSNGQIEEQDIPISEYRSLRWNIGDINAGQKISVFARVHLVPLAPIQAKEGKK